MYSLLSAACCVCLIGRTRTLAHVIHDRTCFASSLKCTICPSILSMASLYALSYDLDPVGSIFKVVLMALGDLFLISESR